MLSTGLTEDLFELTGDVVVVGSGAAATAAAAAAASEGLQVVLLERAEAFGGTTALSGAGAWILNNRWMQAEGATDPKEPAMRYMCKLAYPNLYDPDAEHLGLPADRYAMIETFYDRGEEAVGYLEDIGAAQFYADMALPDYFANDPDNAAPYGRKISPPERKLGHAGAGPGHIGRMIAYIESHGGITRTNHRVMSLLENEAGEIIGCEVHAGHRTILVRAKRAIVFGSGGFLHNAELRREFLMGPTFGGCGVSTATGDFVRMGTEVGAQLGNMTHAWWYQVLLENTIETSQTAGGLFMPFGDSMIQVNRHGRRAMNEKAPYNERGPVHFAWDGRELPNLVMCSIFDDDVLNSEDTIGHRWPVPMPGEQVNYLISGDTLEELAVRIDERLASLKSHTGGFSLAPNFVANLKETIERFNGFADRGVDEDFGRGEEEISRLWSGEVRDGANNTMHRFRDSGPYHSMLLVAGALDTNGGPRTNTSSQVLDTRGEPIPGLYGAGNCVASPAGQAYWGPGATIGCGLVFGYIAGRACAQEKEKAL
jgi:succinate dehydrogenase/fumarate reductase flavoprotein subunit